MKWNLTPVLAVVLLAVGLFLVLQRRHAPPTLSPAEEANRRTTGLPLLSNDSIDSHTLEPRGQKEPHQPTSAFASRGSTASEAAAWQDQLRRWRTPLHYFGKVVDENDLTIQGARVSFVANSVNESLTEDETPTGTAVTDALGIFEISGIRGIGLTFQVTHPNYYAYPDSPHSFDLRNFDDGSALPDTQVRAVVIRMHSKGTPVPLVHRVAGGSAPLDGSPGIVELRGREDSSRIGRIEVRAWGDPPKSPTGAAFDWKVQILVPNGGLVPSTNYFDFIAPANGYVSSVEFVMDKASPHWKDETEQLYFLRLPTGYARARIHMAAVRPFYINVDYFYNPTGSQNLEPSR